MTTITVITKDGITEIFENFYDEEGMGTLVNDVNDECINIDVEAKQIYCWHTDGDEEKYIDFIKLIME